MTTLHITVGDREQLRQDALQFVQDVEVGDFDDQDGKATLQFGTYDDFVDSLTPLRLCPSGRSQRKTLKVFERRLDSLIETCLTSTRT